MRAARERQHHRLGQQLTRQPREPGAERVSRRQLLDPRARPHQHRLVMLTAPISSTNEHAAPQQIERARGRPRRDPPAAASTTVWNPALMRISLQMREAIEVPRVQRVDLLLAPARPSRPACSRATIDQLLLCRESSDFSSGVKRQRHPEFDIRIDAKWKPAGRTPTIS